MIEITETAASELKTILEKEEKLDHSLRIFVAGMGCSGIQYGLALDNEVKDEDVTVESRDIKIVLAEDIAGELDEAKIDYIESEHGSGFVIDNPKAASACGSCSSCH